MPNQDIPSASDVDQAVASTTLTSIRVIEELKENGPAGVSELASALDLAKGTVHKHLATLRTAGYVVKGDDSYRIGLVFLGIGSAVRARMQIYEEAYEPIRNLAEVTGETASVMIPENEYGVYLLRENTDDDLDTDLREGEQVPLHATAGGKAILAYTPPAEREAILDRRKSSAFTPETVTDRNELESELRMIQDKRLAHDRGEYEADTHCVAVPVTDADDTAIAAVTISGPADRMRLKSADADFSSIVGSTAASIQNRLARP